MVDRRRIPRTCDVLVIGGGPAGSSAAAAIAKDGFDVVLFDKSRHPRPQVGESLIPHIWRLADNLGVTDALDAEGFLPKAGGIFAWDGRVSRLRFADFGYDRRGGLHIERERFDELLLRHAEALGALVYEDVIARNVDFSRPGHPAVIFDDRRGDQATESSIEARFVVDASGHSGLLARQLDARNLVHSDRRFLSLWGAFEGGRFFDIEGDSHAASALGAVRPATFIEKYEDGWIWHVALRGRASVGLVMDNDRTRGLGRAEQEAYFHQTLARAPYIGQLLREARYVEGSLAARPDYSYYSDALAGDDFFCVGDAASFVDPLFSQGVLTAMFHASTAAWAITGTFRNRAKRAFHLEVFKSRVLQYYSASRLIGHGDFGGAGIDPVAAKKLVRALPRAEVELFYTAAWTTGRQQNLVRMLDDMGVDARYLQPKAQLLAGLHV